MTEMFSKLMTDCKSQIQKNYQNAEQCKHTYFFSIDIFKLLIKKGQFLKDNGVGPLSTAEKNINYK